ncbi:MAG: flavodoxin [Oscillospiraceae bacterium]|nr:flavodoxin [Oscillospiraceae bacterium]
MEPTNGLVVYFSHTGKNYVNGSITELKKGNTAVAAEMIAAITGADLFEIEPAREYPFHYQDCTAAAQKELQTGARPKLAKTIDTGRYDVLYLGYPNWWGTMPMPILTFLEGQDLSGKVILPFCTNEGSGMGNSERDLKKACPKSTLQKGLAIRGSQVTAAKSAIEKWIKEELPL